MSEIRIAFEASGVGARRLQVLEQPVLAEHEQIWVWGLCYALCLYHLGDEAAGRQLRETLDGWAVQMASKMFLPLAKIHQAGLLVIDPDVSVTDRRDLAVEDGCVLRTRAVPGRDWPGIELETPDALSDRRRSDLVLGLAQYYLLQNKLFLKELPVHLLAYRKFYTDHMATTDPASIEQAPLFALNKSLELYENMRRTFERQQDRSP